MSMPPHRDRGRTATIVTIALLCITVSACSGTSLQATSVTGRPGAPAPLSATAPYVRMTSAETGWAVWPSGSSWLVLRTSDGWSHVTNATPIGVPTNGGLVIDATSAGAVAVAVAAYDRLLSSPLLTKSSATAAWRPAELPGAVTNARSAVAITSTATTAVLRTAGGTVVTGGDAGWVTVIDAGRLAPGRQLRLDGITWADKDLGWLTGHAPLGSIVAFQTTDGGRRWAPIPAATRSVVAALAPCGIGQAWVLPTIRADGKIAFLRTSDAGTTWTRGRSLKLGSGAPVWGCHGDALWSAGRAGNADHVFSSQDAGRSWTDRGRAPAGLTDLSPVGDGKGFACSRTDGQSRLWSVTEDGARYAERHLPGWVSSIGAAGSTS
jgi:hypothetical protein